MPDWFYRTISRPILYRMGPRPGRSLALGFMGRLSRLPLGTTIIDWLGHMRADDRLAVTVAGVSFPSPVGLASGLDVEAVALPALARFGCGFLTIGPVAVNPPPNRPEVERDDTRETIGFPDEHSPLGLATALDRIREAAALGVPLVVRIAPQNSHEAGVLAAAVAPHARLILLPVGSDVGIAVANASAVPVFVEVPTNEPHEKLAAALAAGATGVLVTGELPRPVGGVDIGAAARDPAQQGVRAIREQFGPELPIVACGGIHEPEDALAVQAAGANLIGIDSGLVFTGPGLVKRVNDAVLYRKLTTEVQTLAPQPERPAEMTWFWTLLMGVGMLIGSVLALGIATTRVVLPYDEAFLNMSRAELATINPRLLAFMAHDRVSVAGTMIAVGIMYVGLSLGGIRRGLHWAMVAVFTSAFVGFSSFFLFLGFGYLDTLHAFVTACLLQLLLLGVHAKLGTHRPEVPPTLKSDRAWQRAQWGQLLLVFHACGVIGAGLVISMVGITHVFVHEDLEFMQTTTEALTAANPRLLPMVAHDRATFGGMLVSTGLVLLLSTLWGFRAGNSWLWYTFLAAIVAGYVPAIAVHFLVGYDDWFHLLPACGGFALALFALLLARPLLCQSVAELRAAWERIGDKPIGG